MILVTKTSDQRDRGDRMNVYICVYVCIYLFCNVLMYLCVGHLHRSSRPACCSRNINQREAGKCDILGRNQRRSPCHKKKETPSNESKQGRAQGNPEIQPMKRQNMHQTNDTFNLMFRLVSNIS